MRVVFFRHLPTINNLNKVFLGRIDLRCDKKYIDEHSLEIHAIKESNKFEKIFCSPLIRTVQTTNIYFPNNPYIIDRRLIERDLGNWKNVSKRIVREQHPEAFFQNGNLNFNYTPPNGESFSDVLKRVASFLLDINDNYRENDSIGVVTHNGIITAVKCMINNTTSTEEIEFQPFLTEFQIELDEKLIKTLNSFFSDYSSF